MFKRIAGVAASGALALTFAGGVSAATTAASSADASGSVVAGAKTPTCGSCGGPIDAGGHCGCSIVSPKEPAAKDF